MSNQEINARIADLNARLIFDRDLRDNFEKAISNVFVQAGHHLEPEVLDKIEMTSNSFSFDMEVLAGPQSGA